MQVHYRNNYLHYNRDNKCFRAPYSEKTLLRLKARGYNIRPALTLDGALKMELYPYQLTAVHAANKNGGSLLLADEMGLGKTASAIACMVEQKAQKTLIVVPSNVKYQWKRNIKMWLRKAPHVMTCEGETFELADAVQMEKSRIVIINYEILDYWALLLCRMRWDMAILDEGHRIKKSTAQCTLAMRQVRPFVKSCIVLTGTPLTDRNADIYNVVWMVNQSLFPSEHAFQQKYCISIMGDGLATTSVNTLELHHILTSSGTMLRRVKAEVEAQTRVVHMRVVAFKTDMESLTSIEESVKKIQALAGKSCGQARSRYLFQRQQSLEEYLQEAIRLKLPYTIRWIEKFLHMTGAKLVVACVHREKCGVLLKEHFGERAVLIDGSNTARQRDVLIQKFCKDKNVPLLIGNIRSVGTGIDGLQRVCKNMVLCEFPWSPGELQQLFARLDRAGQRDEMSIYLHTVHGTMDHRMAKTLDRKANILSEVLDGKSLDSNKKLTKLIKESL